MMVKVHKMELELGLGWTKHFDTVMGFIQCGRRKLELQRYVLNCKGLDFFHVPGTESKK